MFVTGMADSLVALNVSMVNHLKMVMDAIAQKDSKDTIATSKNASMGGKDAQRAGSIVFVNNAYVKRAGKECFVISNHYRQNQK